MAQTTYHPAKGKDLDAGALTADSLVLNGASVVTALLLASGQVVDLNGEADALILDAAQNLRIDGSSAGHIKIKISGAYDFDITANTLTALSGSTIATNTIAETSAGSGITADSVLLKDGGIVLADGAAIAADVVSEKTAAAGVTIDSVLLKDNTSSGGRQSQILTATGAITVGNHGVVQLNHATVIIAATLAAPQAGADLMIVDNSASGTAAHTVTLPAGVTFVGGSNNTATFDAPGEALHIVAMSATKWFIMVNVGSVALSTV